MFKKIVTALLVLSLIFAACVIYVNADEPKAPEAGRDNYANPVKGGKVNNIEELLAAFTDSREGNNTVYATRVGEGTAVRLEENVVLTNPIIINSGDYTILGADRTVYRGSSYHPLFLLNSTSAGLRPSLTLKDDITLDGMSDKFPQADSGLVVVFGASAFTAENAKFTYSDSVTSSSAVGGAIYMLTNEESGDDRLPLAPKVILDGCEFLQCRASSGGAIASKTTGKSIEGSARITNCKFKNNSVPQGESYANGGAIYITAGYFEIENCVFENNSADYGGAIYSNVKLSVKNSEFSYNSARELGGALYSHSYAETEKCKMQYNSASDGGAVAGRGTLVSQSDYLSENEASQNGGAVYFDGTYKLFDAVIMNNTAARLGGGIFMPRGTSELELEECEIFGNKAEYCGSLYCGGALDFKSGGIGTGASEFPQIYVGGAVKLGEKSSVLEDVLAISVKKTDAEKVYTKIEYTAPTLVSSALNVAYAEEKLDKNGAIVGFSNVTASGVEVFSGSPEAVKKAVEKAIVAKKGLLSYKLNADGVTSVRMLGMPIFIWVIILLALAASVTCAIVFKDKLKVAFQKNSKAEKAE